MGIVQLGDTEIKIYLEMVETITQQPCAALTFNLYGRVNHQRGKKSFSKVFEELRVDIPSYGQPRGLSLQGRFNVSLTSLSEKYD